MVEGSEKKKPQSSDDMGKIRQDRGLLVTKTHFETPVPQQAANSPLTDRGALCAKVRPQGSVRGGLRKEAPYRDIIF